MAANLQERNPQSALERILLVLPYLRLDYMASSLQEYHCMEVHHHWLV
jgi:hypothetical protein